MGALLPCDESGTPCLKNGLNVITMMMELDEIENTTPVSTISQKACENWSDVINEHQ